MKGLLVLAGCFVLWSNVAVAQGAADLIFADGFENHPDAVEILSLNANPASIYEGGSTTISWVLKDADSCTATQGTAEWQALTFNGTDGSFEVTTLATEGVYPFTLTCTGQVGAPSVATVAVAVSVEPLSCDPPSLNAGLDTDWSAFWGYAFPNSPQAILHWINTGQYLSVAFDTGSVTDNGNVFTIDNNYTVGSRLVAISRCAGRFEAPAECTHTWADGQGDTSTITWATDGKAGACVLEPNTIYYLNVTFTDGVDSSTDSCDTTPSCFVTIKHVLDPL